MPTDKNIHLILSLHIKKYNNIKIKNINNYLFMTVIKENVQSF